MRRNVKKIIVSAVSILILIGAAVVFAFILKWPVFSPAKRMNAASQQKTPISREIPSEKTPPAGIDTKADSSEVFEAGRKKDTPDALSNLALRGTVNWDSEYARAVIENIGEREQGIYKIGDIVNNGTIRKIAKTWVVINFDGMDRMLTMAVQSRAAENGSGKMTLARSELETAFADPKGWMSQVRIKSYSDQGTRGLRIESIAPGSIFDKMGFSEGDIIEEINGAEIKRPGVLAALFEGARFLPTEIFSMEDFGSRAESLLLTLDSRSQGVAGEVSKLYRKIETGEDIPVKFKRGGVSQKRIFKVQ